MSEQTIDNGGPAFPSSLPAYADERIGWAGDTIPVGSGAHYRGLSVREYIAIEAMKMHGAALMDADISSEDAWDEMVTKRSVKTADAMIKQLKGGAA